MQRLGESWDVVEVVRSLSQAVGLLTTEVDCLQKIVAGQEARLQVLEGKQVSRWATWLRSLNVRGADVNALRWLRRRRSRFGSVRSRDE